TFDGGWSPYQVYIAANNGTLYGFNPNSMSQSWSYSLGAVPTSYPFPINGGFLIAGKDGGVYEFTANASSATKNLTSTVPGPSGCVSRGALGTSTREETTAE